MDVDLWDEEYIDGGGTSGGGSAGRVDDERVPIDTLDTETKGRLAKWKTIEAHKKALAEQKHVRSAQKQFHALFCKNTAEIKKQPGFNGWCEGYAIRPKADNIMKLYEIWLNKELDLFPGFDAITSAFLLNQCRDKCREGAVAEWAATVTADVPLATCTQMIKDAVAIIDEVYFNGLFLASARFNFKVRTVNDEMSQYEIECTAKVSGNITWPYNLVLSYNRDALVSMTASQFQDGRLVRTKLDSLLKTLQHEMLHVLLWKQTMESGVPAEGGHGKLFQTLGCKLFGFKWHVLDVAVRPGGGAEMRVTPEECIAGTYVYMYVYDKGYPTMLRGQVIEGPQNGAYDDDVKVKVVLNLLGQTHTAASGAGCGFSESDGGLHDDVVTEIIAANSYTPTNGAFARRNQLYYLLLRWDDYLLLRSDDDISEQEGSIDSDADCGSEQDVFIDTNSDLEEFYEEKDWQDGLILTMRLTTLSLTADGMQPTQIKDHPTVSWVDNDSICYGKVVDTTDDDGYVNVIPWGNNGASSYDSKMIELFRLRPTPPDPETEKIHSNTSMAFVLQHAKDAANFHLHNSTETLGTLLKAFGVTTANEFAVLFSSNEFYRNGTFITGTKALFVAKSKSRYSAIVLNEAKLAQDVDTLLRVIKSFYIGGTFASLSPPLFADHARARIAITRRSNCKHANM